MNDLVSIIIPTYNRSHLIGETLESIISQTYTNWECIVVDDGSTDNTEELLVRYIEKDRRIQYHRRPDNRRKGAPTCRNYGFELSKGHFVQYFDSDDILVKDALMKKMKFFNDDVSVVVCGFHKFTETKKWGSWNIDIKTGVDILKLYYDSKIVFNTQCFMYSRGLIQQHRFDESLAQAQDLDFVFNIYINNTFKTAFVNEDLTAVRMHDNSISSASKLRTRQQKNSNLKVGNQVLKYCLSKKQYSQFHLKAVRKYLLIIRNGLDIMTTKRFFKEIWCLPISRLTKLKLCAIGLCSIFFGKGSNIFTKVAKSIVLVQ